MLVSQSRSLVADTHTLGVSGTEVRLDIYYIKYMGMRDDLQGRSRRSKGARFPA